MVGRSALFSIGAFLCVSQPAGAEGSFADRSALYVERSHRLLDDPARSHLDDGDYCARVLAGEAQSLPDAPAPRLVGLRVRYSSAKALRESWARSAVGPAASAWQTAGLVVDADQLYGAGFAKARERRAEAGVVSVYPLCRQLLSRTADRCTPVPIPSASASGTPDDARFQELWGHRLVNWDWRIARSSRPVTVAVLDSGIDCRHEDLRDKFPGTNLAEADGARCSSICPAASGADFVFGEPTQGNCHVNENGGVVFDSHGTAMASTIAATGNNGRGLVGVAPNATLRSYRVLRNADTFGQDADRIRRAIPQAFADGARVLNMSLYAEEGSKLAVLCDELAAVTASRGAPLVTTMSKGDGSPYFTACKAKAPDILSVSAIQFDEKDYLDLLGGSPPADLHAPGAYILSAISGQSALDAYADVEGSSSAVAYVSGAAAQVWGLGAFASCSASQMRHLLTCTAQVMTTCNGQEPIRVLDLGFLSQVDPGKSMSCSDAIDQVARAHKACGTSPMSIEQAD